MILYLIILYLCFINYKKEKYILELQECIIDINNLYIKQDEELFQLEQKYNKTENIKTQLEKAFKKRNKINNK